ncbi:hypothetical protein INT43_008333 [Umbelopsis isabellina]|uniref:Uncharacterized protein n=1 Tax=Mortierella isabellina TaxID=91625 RepID=A0A8H7U877_MORIS|nr:hypothetical protein INT43_008333 [Umbelopsis isabellina]
MTGFESLFLGETDRLCMQYYTPAIESTLILQHSQSPYFLNMYLAYKAYKKHQQKKKEREASKANGTYEPRLSDTSKVTEVSMDFHPSTAGGAPPAFSWNETKPGSAKKQRLMLFGTLLVDVVLPIMLYEILKQHISQLVALLISSAPPCAMVIFRAIFHRRLDPLGSIIIISFAITAAVSVIDSNPRILLFKDSITTGSLGTIFLSSLIPIKIWRWQIKPMTYSIASQMLATQPNVQYLKNGEMIDQAFPEFIWENSPIFRKCQRILTAGWGVALLMELVAKLIMYFSTLTVDQIFIYGNVIAGVLLGSMGLVTTVFSHFIRKWTKQELDQVKERIETEAAMHATSSESCSNAGASV